MCPVRQSFFIYNIRPAETVQLQVGRLTFFYLFFCVCIALLKNQQHPTYGLGKVRTTGGSEKHHDPEFRKPPCTLCWPNRGLGPSSGTSKNPNPVLTPYLGRSDRPWPVSFQAIQTRTLKLVYVYIFKALHNDITIVNTLSIPCIALALHMTIPAPQLGSAQTGLPAPRTPRPFAWATLRCPRPQPTCYSYCGGWPPV